MGVDHERGIECNRCRLTDAAEQDCAEWSGSDFEAGEEQVLVPIESASPGSVLVAVVGGAGYTVGVRSSADVAIEAVASAQVCGEEPTDDPAGIDPTDTPRTTPLPAAPGLAPPAQAITGPAHLAG